jgi:hypothetical protein
MDPVTIIVTALAAGAVDAFKPAATEAVKDAYGKLKSTLINKFGRDSDVGQAVQKVEERPESEGRKALLEEELTAVKEKLDVEPKLAQELLKLTSYHANLTGDGTIVQGQGNIVAGSGGVAIGGDVQGGITMGDTISGDYVQGDKVLGDKIGSQINTAGGDYVGGDNIKVGNISGSSGVAIGRGASASVSTTQQSRRDVNYDALFAPLQSFVAAQAPEISGKVNTLKAQVSLGESANDDTVANLIQDIVDAAPGAKPLLIDLFAVPDIAAEAGPTTKFVLSRLK